jgi:hypothetical protein
MTQSIIKIGRKIRLELPFFATLIDKAEAMHNFDSPFLIEDNTFWCDSSKCQFRIDIRPSFDSEDTDFKNFPYLILFKYMVLIYASEDFIL